jgi:hypothetical protein
MTRSILLVAAGIFVAALFACVQTPPPSPKQASNCTFNANSVGVLQPTFVPNPASGPAPGRYLQAGVPLSPQMITDINAAFANAPVPVQNDLCALSGIFIDTSSCQNGAINPCNNINPNLPPVSWGYRSTNRNGDAGSMYIAIPASLWLIANTTAISFSSYEEMVLQYFAKLANPTWGSPAEPLPTIYSVNYNNATTDLGQNISWPTVLVALSHELGHVKFNYTIHQQNNYGQHYSFGSLQPCYINSTHSSMIADFFSGWYDSSKPKKLVPPGSKGYWRQFNHQDNDDSNNYVEHSAAPFLADLSDPRQNPNPLLYTLYSDTSQPWASLWGAWSPDEDFVETYVLYALSANVTSLKISIGGNSPYDVIGGITVSTGTVPKQTLYGKMQCLANLPAI